MLLQVCDENEMNHNFGEFDLNDNLGILDVHTETKFVQAPKGG